jgi:hypothetical protein
MAVDKAQIGRDRVDQEIWLELGEGDQNGDTIKKPMPAILKAACHKPLSATHKKTATTIKCLSFATAGLFDSAVIRPASRIHCPGGMW